MEKHYKNDFPLLKSHLENGKPIVYLDNAATTQKPDTVIEAVRRFYRENDANPHRGAYALSADATALYEGARKKAAGFIHAGSPNEIVFTKNASESLNLVARGYAASSVKPGDEILLTIAEHHSNLLPWQALAQEKGAVLRYLYTGGEGSVSLEEAEQKINRKTKIVALTHTSNVIGAKNPVAEITELAHAVGAAVVLDGAQGVPHTAVDVTALDVDFMAFSGHKMLAPDGIGVLYGKAEKLEETSPLLLGGGIVEEVTEQTVRLLEAPLKFEAGTPNVEGAVGLQAAIAYMEAIGIAEIEKREAALTRNMMEQMASIPNVSIYGSSDPAFHNGIVSFNVQDVHPHDVASILDAEGITIRAGHHCAQPLMKHLGIHSCCRASISFYNTPEDIDRFAAALSGVRRWLGL